jgi:hypothetical protein
LPDDLDSIEPCGQKLPPVLPCNCPGCWFYRRLVEEIAFSIDREIMVEHELRQAGIRGGEIADPDEPRS